MRDVVVEPVVCSEGGVHLWANWPIEDKTYRWVICERCGLAHVLDEDEVLFSGRVVEEDAL